MADLEMECPHMMRRADCAMCAQDDLTQPPAGVYVPSITTDNTATPRPADLIDRLLAFSATLANEEEDLVNEAAKELHKLRADLQAREREAAAGQRLRERVLSGLGQSRRKLGSGAYWNGYYEAMQDVQAWLPDPVNVKAELKEKG